MARLLCLLLLPLAACSCATSAPRPGAAPESVIAFRALEGDLIEVPVRLNGAREVRFVLDTGIGVTLVSRALCAELGCEPAGGYVGRRMSGQEIHVPLARIGEIALGPHRRAGEVVGLVDLEGFVPPGSAVQVLAPTSIRRMRSRSLTSILSSLYLRSFGLGTWWLAARLRSDSGRPPWRARSWRTTRSSFSSCESAAGRGRRACRSLPRGMSSSIPTSARRLARLCTEVC